MTKLSGAVPAKKVEEVKHEDHKTASDTLAHAEEGVKGEEAKGEEKKTEGTKEVVEAAPMVPNHK